MCGRAGKVRCDTGRGSTFCFSLRQSEIKTAAEIASRPSLKMSIARDFRIRREIHLRHVSDATLTT